MKKFISAVTAIAMLFGIFCCANNNIFSEICANAEALSDGSCGINTFYSFDEETGILTISGQDGYMSSYGMYGKNISPFAYNESIKKVVMADGVKSVGSYAFTGCANLEEAVIPKSVENIEAKAFSGTKWLEKKRNENPLVIVNGILIDGASCVGNVVIPSDVKRISDTAFFEADPMTSENIGNITSVIIPEGVKSIGYNAFFDGKFDSVAVPKSVSSIGYGAFGYYFDTEKNYIMRIENFRIYGYTDTAAEKYAAENGFEFIGFDNKCDIDGDGKTTAADALKILMAVTGNIELNEKQRKTADIDGDGMITSNDALAVLEMIVNIK